MQEFTNRSMHPVDTLGNPMELVRAWRVRYLDGAERYKVTYRMHPRHGGSFTPEASTEPLPGVDYAETVEAPFARADEGVTESTDRKVHHAIIEHLPHVGKFHVGCSQGCNLGTSASADTFDQAASRAQLHEFAANLTSADLATLSDSATSVHDRIKAQARINAHRAEADELGEEDTYPATVCGNCLAGCDGVDVGVAYDPDSGRRLCAECRSTPDAAVAIRQAERLAADGHWAGVRELSIGGALYYVTDVYEVPPTPAELIERRIVVWRVP